MRNDYKDSLHAHLQLFVREILYKKFFGTVKPSSISVQTHNYLFFVTDECKVVLMSTDNLSKIHLRWDKMKAHAFLSISTRSLMMNENCTELKIAMWFDKWHIGHLCKTVSVRQQARDDPKLTIPRVRGWLRETEIK